MPRILRCLVCFFLICCILINCSPIKVHAIDPVTFAGVSVAGSIVAASIIQGVGVLPVDSEDGAFGSLVNNCVSFLESTSNFVADCTIRVTGVLNATGGRTAFVPLALVQSVWEWLFQPSSGAALSGSTFNSYYTSDPCTSYSQALSYAAHCPAAYEGNLYTNGRYVRAVIVTSVSQYVSLSDGTLSINGYGTNHSIWYEGLSSWMTRSSSQTYTYTSASKLSTSPLVSSSNDGLKLGEIQSPTYGVDMPILLENAPVYAPWASAITKIPSYSNTDEEIDGIPVSIPGSFESVLGQTQTGAQAGTNDLTWADSAADTNVSSLSDVIAAIKAIPAAIANVFKPSADMGHFTLDLKDFFPFCIPFDLYDFISCLNADPVAPVIDWEIYLPGGDTYPLKLDLAVFDDVAQLLRTLQLLLFCVGLAFKTRDLIKG